jgi:hypothetical protein
MSSPNSPRGIDSLRVKSRAGWPGSGAFELVKPVFSIGVFFILDNR